MHRGAVVQIDLDAIAHNYGVVMRIVGNRPVIAVVKADAYGHGAAEVSKCLVSEGVSCLATAFADEAVALRKAGLRTKILVFFDKGDPAVFFDYNLIPVLHDVRTADRFSQETVRRNAVLEVHIKTDTGMGRMGLNNARAAEDIAKISGMPNIRITGLMSHFSDADIADRTFAEAQMKRFNQIRAALLPGIRENVKCHIANSAAVMSFEESHLDAVRPGLMLYGVSPINGQPANAECGMRNAEVKKSKTVFPELIPAMEVKTRILALKHLSKGSSVSYGRTFTAKQDSLIAVLPVGYADGYSRMFSNNAYVLVNGRRAPVVGRVCMDLTMADVTGIEGINEGDEVVLLGRQGHAEVTAQELAEMAGTIPYEMLTALGSRSKREYINSRQQTN